MQKLSHRFDWSGEFWRFAVLYTVWPPFAWPVTSRLGMTRLVLIRRLFWIAFGYFKTVFVLLLCYLAITSALDGHWLLAGILLLPTLSGLSLILIRIQATYFISKETQT